MKSFASKFNKTTFDIDTTDFQYTKLSVIFNSESEGGKDVIHKINGFYVHKSQLGDSPLIIDEENKRLVNLPSHTAETVREILADDDAVQTIKDGKVGYAIYEYDSHGKKCYSISFVDL
jgi:hypothetical protein